MTEPVRFGRYAVKRVLGRGTVGVVYQARDPDRDRDVVITLLQPPAIVINMAEIVDRFSACDPV